MPKKTQDVNKQFNNSMDLKLIRTNANHQDLLDLIHDLDKTLAVTDGEDHAFYNQYNKLDSIKYVVVAYYKDQPIGCGAIKIFDEKNMEIKRMFVREEARGLGIAGEIMKALETWTQELGYNQCILETGKRQKSAIRLYEKSGYNRMTNYGQYSGVKDSYCFKKSI